ncbi:MAG: Gldg family protein, partial [Parvibaculaceae bacterium]
FSLERADFLEYDLTKMVLKLADPKRKVVGLITDLPVQGGMDPQRGPQPAWLAMQQLEEFFTVKAIAADAAEIPADIDLLLVLSPINLSEKTAFVVDQFALKGKPVLAFVDPNTEIRPFGSPQLAAGNPLLKLLNAWGAKLEPGKVLGDIAYARQVQYGSATQPQVADYVVWMTLDKRAFDARDALFLNVDRIVLASPGALEPAADAGERFKPLVSSSERAMLIDAATLMPPDPEKLLSAYRPGGKSLAFAARLTGEAKTAFPDGAPKPEKAETNATTPAPTAEVVKDGKINVIVVADADILYDTFWAERRQLLGQNFVVPRANNVDLLLNAIENLTGGAALSGLRGRGVEERPFTLVREIRQEAEARYRAQEEALNQKLQETQKRLADIQSKIQGGQVMLSEDDKNAILNFRQEVVATRQALRNVQHALRQDIERLEFWTTFLNTAGLPIVIAIGGLGYLAVRRRKRAASDKTEEKA